MSMGTGWLPISPCCYPPQHKPLVGNAAPDFSATAVFDQEFIDVKLSDYKVCCALGSGVVVGLGSDACGL